MPDVSYNQAAVPTLKEYEPYLSKNAADAREEDISDTYDELSAVMKKHLRDNRKKLVDAGLFEKDGRLTGYGKIADKHVDKESGKRLKEALSHDLMKEVSLYLAKKSGHDDDFIKNLRKGLGAKRKEKVGTKEVENPNHDTRRAYEQTLKSIFDGIYGQAGAYDSLVEQLKDEKNLSRALKGELGELFQNLARNVHPGYRVMKDYQTRLKKDAVEAENFRKHVTGLADKRGYELNKDRGMSIEDLISRHGQYAADPNWVPPSDDNFHLKKKPKK